MIMVSVLVIEFLAVDAEDVSAELRGILSELDHDLFVLGLVEVGSLADVADGHEDSN